VDVEMSEIAASAPNRPDREQKTSCRLLAQKASGSSRARQRQAPVLAGGRFRNRVGVGQSAAKPLGSASSFSSKCEPDHIQVAIPPLKICR
jgi:hypothetical protein